MAKRIQSKGKGLWRQKGPIPPLGDIGLLILGTLISALAVHVFYVPTRLTMGGITGIATIVYQLSQPYVPIPLGLIVLILNIPIMLLGAREISRTFIWRSLIGTVVYSLVLDLTAPTMAPWFETYINRPLQLGGVPDPLLYCLFGGAIFGIGIGLIFRSGFTTGGTDILAIVIKRRLQTLSTGQFLLILDALIVLSTVVFYRNVVQSGILLAMYSFIAMFMTAKAIDLLLEGFDYTRTAFVISDESTQIAGRILTELNRGVTSLSGRGVYTGKDKDVLLCVLPGKQVPELKSIVESVDPQAFVIVVEAREVLGEGFGNGFSL